MYLFSNSRYYSLNYSTKIVIATISVQLHLRTKLNSSYYRLITKCLLLPCRSLEIPIGLTYTINIAMTYQIQITRLC